jgi:hypothetical protein
MNTTAAEITIEQARTIVAEQAGVTVEQTSTMTDEAIFAYVAEMNSIALDMAAKKAALRERVRTSPTLRSVLVPANDFGTADDRYWIAVGAAKRLDAAAEKYDVDALDLAERMLSEGRTMEYAIEQGGDPRFDGQDSAQSFITFNHFLNAAIEDATYARRSAARAAEIAAEDAAWAKQGLERCDRCGGAGGHNSWPGFNCFKCNGAGAVLDVEVVR